MARTTISFTEPNQKWLETQVASKEFKSLSDVVNSALRQIRKDEEDTNMETLIESRMKIHDKTIQKLAK